MDTRRRQWLQSLGSAGVVGLGQSLGWPVLAAAEARQVTVAMTARNSLYHLPVVLAERLGYTHVSNFTTAFKKKLPSGRQVIEHVRGLS